MKPDRCVECLTSSGEKLHDTSSTSGTSCKQVVVILELFRLKLCWKWVQIQSVEHARYYTSAFTRKRVTVLYFLLQAVGNLGITSSVHSMRMFPHVTQCNHDPLASSPEISPFRRSYALPDTPLTLLSRADAATISTDKVYKAKKQTLHFYTHSACQSSQ